MLYTDKSFSKAFCAPLLYDCLTSIAAGHSFNLVAIPGVGVTFFVRHLTSKSPGTFISVNSFELHEFSKLALYHQLAYKLGLTLADPSHVDLRAISDAINARAQNDKKVVLVFNRFDRLGPILDQSFFENLWFLKQQATGSLIMIFVSALPVHEFANTGMQDLLRLVDDTRYLPGYSANDLAEIMRMSTGEKPEPQALRLSGGHHALLQILMRCQNLDNALSDPMVELIIKDLYLGLTPRRQKDIDAVAAGRKKQIDPFLRSIGYIRDDGEKVATFTPLLTEYANRNQQGHLPVRERRLLSMLKRNVGHVVSKQDIFDAVWREENGISSDWALNALVYRLRHHPAFDSQRYTIESHKKQGYVLHDHRK